MSHEIVRPEIAMVSRIRVEVRGESMAAAERVAFQMLDHARLAAVLEGYAPTESEYTDHYFNRPNVTRKFEDGPEDWSEIGLPYYGRVSILFTPMSAYGGLVQYGYQVEPSADGMPTAMPLPDTSHGQIVLERQRPVSREHSWEVSAMGDSADETGESILDDVRSIRDVKNVTATLSEARVGVNVEMDGWENVYATADTLREAAGLARKRVVTMLGDPRLQPGDVHSTGGILDSLTEDYLAHLVAEASKQGFTYRTLFVGSTKALMIAARIINQPQFAHGLVARIDESLEGDQWSLVEEAERQPTFVREVDEGGDSVPRQVLYSSEDEEFTIAVLLVGVGDSQKLRCVVREYEDASRGAVREVYGMQEDAGEGADSVEDLAMRAYGFIEGVRASREAEKST